MKALEIIGFLTPLEKKQNFLQLSVDEYEWFRHYMLCLMPPDLVNNCFDLWRRKQQI